MNTISIQYTYIWRVDYANNYVFTKCGKCFNTKTGRELKRKVKGYTIGYNIKGSFISLINLKPHLVKIKKEILPF